MLGFTSCKTLLDGRLLLFWFHSYGLLRRDESNTGSRTGSKTAGSKSGSKFDSWCKQNGVDVNAIPLLHHLLTLDPKKRVMAKDAFNVGVRFSSGHGERTLSCISYKCKRKLQGEAYRRV